MTGFLTVRSAVEEIKMVAPLAVFPRVMLPFFLSVASSPVSEGSRRLENLWDRRPI